jgi:hypothetical protein
MLDGVTLKDKRIPLKPAKEKEEAKEKETEGKGKEKEQENETQETHHNVVVTLG